MRRHKLVLAAAIVTLLAFAPLLSVLLSGGLARLFHCEVGHGQAQACLVAGVDITPTLVGLGMFGYFAYVSWVLLVPAAILWAVVLGRSIFRRFRLIATGEPDPRGR